MLSILIIVCAFGGLLLATFIHIKKKVTEPLICPIGHSCDPVVHSAYSRFLGIPVEWLGILYYLIILLCHSALLMYPTVQTSEVGLVLFGMSALALLFSLYLTSVQAFVLKEWCSWCLISALLCAAISFASFRLSGVELLSLLGIGN